MKTTDQIQRAHDLLVAMVLGETPVKVAPEDITLMMVQSDVLCWMLGHEHNRTFERVLEQIESRMLAAGYQLVDRGGPPVRRQNGLPKDSRRS